MPTELFDLLEEYSDRNKPFVIYRMPGNSILKLLSQDSDKVYQINDFSEQGFIMTAFTAGSVPILIPPDLVMEFKYSPKVHSLVLTPFEPGFNKIGQERHLSIVSRAVEAIRLKNLEKVVLARKIEFSMEDKPFQLFENLLHEHPNAFCYLWFHPEIGLWLGASPELLLAMENNFLTTFSLAGTKSYEAEELPEWGAKEIEEQEFVTSYILDCLSRMSILAKASEPESVRAGNLWHLKTVIEAQLSDNALDRILRALHPTPAICGIPKNKAIEFIEQNERLDRKFYSGYLGELNLGKNMGSRLYVNLRCMEWFKEKASVYVGGGITGQSEPMAEWLETEEKSKTILNALFNYNK